MRWLHILEPQLTTLLHTEAVLLVNHHDTQITELHIRFQQSVRANQDMQRTILQLGMNLVSLLLTRTARQQSDTHLHARKEFDDALVMLRCQNLRRRHDTGLKTIVQCHQHRHQRHHRLAAAHIPLQEAVHLTATAHIGTNLLEHTFLRPRQFKRQMMIVEVVEVLPYSIEHKAAIPLLTHLERANQVELQIEQFLKLQSSLSPLQVLGRSRKMNLPDGLIIRHQLIMLNDIGRQSLRKRIQMATQKTEDNALYGLGVQHITLHLFGCIVHTHQRLLGIDTCLRGRFQFRMNHLKGMVELTLLGLTEQEIVLLAMYAVLDVSKSIEPDALNDACPVRE